MSYIKDNYDLWKEHDALQGQIEKKIELIDSIISDVEQALSMLEDDFDKGCEMLNDLIVKLEGER